MSDTNEENDNKQVCMFDFRSNVEYYSKEKLINFLVKYCKFWAFQIEKGELNGYIHYQGRLSLIKKKYKNHLLSLFEKELLKKPNYLMPSCNSVKSSKNFNYVLKEDTKVEGPYTDKNYKKHPGIKFIPEYIPYQIQHINEDSLYSYQRSIIESGLLKNRNSRVIDCIYDKLGNRGKSTISNYIGIYKLGYDMPPINNYKELTNAVCDILLDNQDHDPKLMLFDIPRATQNINSKPLHEMMAAFEQIKKGRVSDGRHSFKEWIFDSPRIWIFTNDIIDKSLLSSDRWNIWTINNSNELVPYGDETNIYFIGDDDV